MKPSGVELFFALGDLTSPLHQQAKHFNDKRNCPGFKLLEIGPFEYCKHQDPAKIGSVCDNTQSDYHGQNCPYQNRSRH